jgi:recombinational DNA repair protein RecR
METRENEKQTSHIRFTGDDIELAAKMLDQLTSTIDIVYYLLNRGDERSFVVMLLSAKNVDMNMILKEQKRNTDILFEIDKEASIYAIVCQDTKIDGGYHFAERVLQSLISNKADEIYCTQLEVRTTTYDIKYIIFKLIENYIKIKADKRESEIVFKTLH